MSEVHREFGGKIQVMEIKIRKLTLDLINGGKKTHTHTEARVDYYERLLTIAKRKFKVAR